MQFRLSRLSISLSTAGERKKEEELTVRKGQAPRTEEGRRTARVTPSLPAFEELTNPPLPPSPNTVPEPAGWPAQPGDWHCALTADSRKLERIGKAWIKYTWIREKDDEIELFNLIGDEERIVEYLGTLVAEPERALRFSDVGAREELQMLIPTAVVNGGDLDLWAVCFETEAELRAFSDEVVDWEAWGDIQGEPQHGYS
ncbi:hypothetical protein MBM_03685 [Drepanopeziza brunnea f. sp. 'multigermtubi' MB_m1]|uniref:Uncharacterized protein n=1 Tax=Marssonina brunnea f. sp. multigermtubi (strain MB_m1) TaxID=1072389 RepID=K1XB02_MARBU|nr:uncharacterized protein MBM_03685 [Drepanopeziza brunnea f. sp. 'multigermtubi' MB_m1]EKD17913.1 hypothetical protein MBM_03685 [Drepanopeziza brunnea f. sp. 'multigermtubi' MB_m1]